jgi:hypothetical protein
MSTQASGAAEVDIRDAFSHVLHVARASTSAVAQLRHEVACMRKQVRIAEEAALVVSLSRTSLARDAAVQATADVRRAALQVAELREVLRRTKAEAERLTVIAQGRTAAAEATGLLQVWAQQRAQLHARIEALQAECDELRATVTRLTARESGADTSWGVAKSEHVAVAAALPPASVGSKPDDGAGSGAVQHVHVTAEAHDTTAIAAARLTILNGLATMKLGMQVLAAGTAVVMAGGAVAALAAAEHVAGSATSGDGTRVVRAAYGLSTATIGLAGIAETVRAVDDRALTASSHYHIQQTAAASRLGREIKPGVSVFCLGKGKTTGEWVQVDLGGARWVAGALTQGRPSKITFGAACWREVQFCVSMDGKAWTAVDGGATWRRPDDANDDEVVWCSWSHAYRCRFVRTVLVAAGTDASNVRMRWDLLTVAMA